MNNLRNDLRSCYRQRKELLSAEMSQDDEFCE